MRRTQLVVGTVSMRQYDSPWSRWQVNALQGHIFQNHSSHWVLTLVCRNSVELLICVLRETRKYLSPLLEETSPCWVLGLIQRWPLAPPWQLGHHTASQPRTWEAGIWQWRRAQVWLWQTCASSPLAFGAGQVPAPLQSWKSVSPVILRSMCEPMDTFLSEESAASRAFQLKACAWTHPFVPFPSMSRGASRWQTSP